MTRILSSGSRRPVLLYLGAVVGPTLVVLTLGALAAVRQHEAVEALRVTTRRLQEGRIADEVESALTGAATAALADPASVAMAASVVDDDPTGLDGVRRLANVLRQRHPLVAHAFAFRPDGMTYPLLDAPLPRDLADWIAAEPHGVRQTVRTVLDAASSLEVAKRPRDAALAYERAHQLATTTRLSAFALAGLARSEQHAGNSAKAVRAWEDLARSYGGTYSLAGRPHALVAAVELRALVTPAPPVVREVSEALERGTWTLTPDQAEYFRAALGRPPASNALAAEIAFARALRGWQAPAAPGQLQAAWLESGDRSWQVFQVQGEDGVTRGFAVDPDWVRAVLVPRAGTSIVTDVPVQFARGTSEGVPLQRVFPGWKVSLAPDPQSAQWLRADVLAFVAAIGVVLGLLVMGVVLLVRDVSRQAALNRMRADLVSGVSHELKAPLSVIRVYAETLANASDAPPADRTHFATAILQEADRLHRVIDDVVDFSRIEQGQRSYRRVPTPMVALLNRVIARFGEYASLHGFRLSAAVPSDLPAVTVDPLAVEQAVHNLLDNACKYSGDARDIELSAGRGDTHLTIEVRDHGIGIAPDEQSRIFERFHRGRHEDRGGYGLGLYLVHHVMEAHGGQVDVDSSPGAGSRFRLHFPLEDTRAESAADRG